MGVACTYYYKEQAWERFQLSISLGWVVAAAASGGGVAALGILAKERTLVARKGLLAWIAFGALAMAILLTAATYVLFDHEERRRASLTPAIPALISPHY